MNVELFNQASLQLLKKATTALEKQHSMIAENVANVNNPHYKARHTDFLELLNTTMENTGLKNTHETHFKSINNEASPLQEIRTKDGSSQVDLVREMSDMAANQIRYEFITNALRGYYGKLKSVITSNNQ